MSLNKMRKEDSLKYKTSADFEMPTEIRLLHSISDCGDFLNGIYMITILNGHRNGLMRHIGFYQIMEVWLFLVAYNSEMINQEIY